MRPAIYVPFPQAVPARPVIDSKTCAKLIRNGCGLCEKKCKARGHQLQGPDKVVEEKVGAVVVATGYQLYNIGKKQDKAGEATANTVTASTRTSSIRCNSSGWFPPRAPPTA